MRLLRRKRSSSPAIDYGKVAEQLRKKRTESRQDFSKYSASSQEVRTYRPKESLSDLNARVQRLISDAEDQPRNWGPERTDGAVFIWFQGFLVPALVAANIILSSCVYLMWMTGFRDEYFHSMNERFPVYLLVVAAGFLGWKSIRCLRLRPFDASVGVIASSVELIAALAIIVLG